MRFIRTLLIILLGPIVTYLIHVLALAAVTGAMLLILLMGEGVRIYVTGILRLF